MLQDLDARRAANERGMLPNEVRALPPERPARAGYVVAGLIVIGALAAGAFWLQSDEVAAPVAATSKPVPIAPAALSPPVAATLLGATEGAPAPAAAPAPNPAATPDDMGAPTPPTVAGGGGQPGRETLLRIETALRTRPAEPPADAPKPAARPARAEEAPPTIEKQMRTTAPRDRAENDYRRAVTLVNQGRIGDAIGALRAAVDLDAAHLPARITLAGLLVEQKRLDEAQGVLAEGLVQAPGQAQLALRLARIQAERGDLRAAAETLQIAAANGAGNAEFHGVHAAVLQRLGRHREAAEEYLAALRGSPQSGVWWMGLGIALEGDGRPAEARDAFQRARATGALSAELDRFVEQRLRQIQ